ncbi:hypothetical protein A3A39_04450 [Candidatus Kaiserbacteria bacterium RIFCSPLOWO2_01_FULL_54_13]|uniref:Putative pre-16S rRNA nuclease n=1 Tax=Candidatus Kaiserbacteria bacterium RIFCSPLOWO2_01_FULL_54_13 TaxID=1798512 RepID=A0A1F6F1K8_9BACT|nr:MAG: hypothetical protein A3A39_04450 [Candidatus Kaiserbacteria bacterium RIFCSPLOWO2_01_FULL_54_13]
MRYLGVDYGSKRVGIAVSDAEGKIAFPRAEFSNDDTLLSSIAKIAAQEGVGKIVVGDTRAFGGGENIITPQVEEFRAQLEKATGIECKFAFEAGSSVEASRYAPEGSEHSNDAAAAFILQRYLDFRKQ